MKKFKAFTLLEVVLSLFLVALLGVFAFYILQGLSQGTRDRRTDQVCNRSYSSSILLFVRTWTTQAPCASGRWIVGVRDWIHGHAIPDKSERDTTIQSEGDTVNFVLPVQQSEVRLISDALPLVYLWHITLANGEGTSSTSFTKTYAPADRVRERLNHVDQDPYRP
ncbi:MAG: type II secretion system protein [Flavobacteriales bacterium]|nr:type II secretion system protein [Flavobacteriales bacterium]